MSRVVGVPAVVLHVRPYRETSAIVSLLTASHGRVVAVARGVRGGRRGQAMQPFNRIRASWQGRGNLATLVSAEPEQHVWLTGESLVAGFYLLELVNRLLHERESMPNVFGALCWSLDCLRDGTPGVDVVLRRFEQLLLAELGYGLEFGRDTDTGEPVDPQAHYRFDPAAGFRRAAAPGTHTVSGDVLLDIAAGDYARRAVRVSAKRILRQALAPHLGHRPLASRRLVVRGRA
jgi:DNA repair protein RecO (recombination protein O)